MRGPSQNVGPFGSFVLTFIGHKQTNKKSRLDKQSIYIDRRQ